MKLAAGLYELLVTSELGELVQDPAWVADLVALGSDAAPDLLARHLFDAIRRSLGGIGGEQRLERQLAVANQVLTLLGELSPKEVEAGDAVTPQLLLSLLRREQAGLGSGQITRPGIPLRHSELIVNGPRDLRVGLEIARELPSADRVDLLMSFVKWSGFVELREDLASFRARGPLRVLTTTYMGASDIEALEGLAELGAEIRVSYDARRTRLHAKAWLFHRDSGFTTAIVGSSNLSQAALRDGCEWNVRLSQRDNLALVAKFRTTFAQYWEDPSFEPYDAERFRQATGVRRDAGRDALASIVQLRPLPHQESVLEALQAERDRGHRRNLVVAATGTGKTVISALDYARQPGRPRLLFVAHRDRILDQSLATFRLALRDGNFGEKLTGREKPILGTHVLASVQSLHERRLRELHPGAFEYVVVDEFHHAAAPTYKALLEHLALQVLRALHDKVRRPRHMRALGFCVTRAHAAFMAAFFAKHDLPAAVVDKDTSPSERDARVRALEHGELCCIFTVDVFNEGVDIPLVDTVLFLRPTESATIFIQQLGRGLRLHDDKALPSGPGLRWECPPRLSLRPALSGTARRRNPGRAAPSRRTGLSSAAIGLLHSARRDGAKGHPGQLAAHPSELEGPGRRSGREHVARRLSAAGRAGPRRAVPHRAVFFSASASARPARPSPIWAGRPSASACPPCRRRRPDHVLVELAL